MASLFDACDELTDENFADDEPEDFDPPRRLEIFGRLFGRNGRSAVYTNIEDADDDRIFEIDPETGELVQWPDCDGRRTRAPSSGRSRGATRAAFGRVVRFHFLFGNR
jgi:hypothetical protein